MLTPSQVIAVADSAHSTLKMILGEPLSVNGGSGLLMLSAAINRKSVYEIHMGWMIQKFKDGWEYGPALDIEAKLHPWLIDLSELDESVLRKNLLFLKIVQTLVPIEVDPSVAAQWAAVETYWDEVFTVKFHREIGEP